MQKGRFFSGMLLAPALIFMLLFLLGPLLYVGVLSLQNTDAMLNPVAEVGLSQYLAVFSGKSYIEAIFVSLGVAVITTVLCVVIALPIAWTLINTQSRALKVLLFIVVVSPLLTSVVIRTFAWIVLLARNGLLNDSLLQLGLIDQPLGMLWNLKAVIIALVQVLIPFAVLPIATALNKLPRDTIRASLNLGASHFYTFRHIVLPLVIPGILSGAIVVYALAVGSYITPLLIGGAMQPILPVTIYQEAIQIGNLPLSSALALILLAITLVVVFLLALTLHRWEKKTYG